MRDEDVGANELSHHYDQMVMRQNLRLHIISHTPAAERSAHEADKLKRLIEILDKHPDLREALGIVSDLGLL